MLPRPDRGALSFRNARHPTPRRRAPSAMLSGAWARRHRLARRSARLDVGNPQQPPRDDPSHRNQVMLPARCAAPCQRWKGCSRMTAWHCCGRRVQVAPLWEASECRANSRGTRKRSADAIPVSILCPSACHDVFSQTHPCRHSRAAGSLRGTESVRSPMSPTTPGLATSRNPRPARGPTRKRRSAAH